MESLKKKKLAHLKRKKRVRKKIWGDETRPRLSVFRSARNIYAQIIVDTTGQTLVQVSSLSPEIRENRVPGKVAEAQKVGGPVGPEGHGKGDQTGSF